MPEITESGFPDYLTHYYRDDPFRSLTDLDQPEVVEVLEQLAQTRTLRQRLSREYRDFYFGERRRFERIMYEQFIGKGGRPRRERPHYLILGESEIWQSIDPHSLTISLEVIPSDMISFTYTDSWCAYVDRTLTGDPIPRKPQYETVYRLEELPALFDEYGWPGDRWQSEPDCEHDVYVEAQVWDDVPLREYLRH